MKNISRDIASAKFMIPTVHKENTYALDKFISRSDIIPIFYEENIVELNAREMFCFFYDLKESKYKVFMYTPQSSKKTIIDDEETLDQYIHIVNKGTDFKRLHFLIHDLSVFMRQHLFLFNEMFGGRTYIRETVKRLYKHFYKRRTCKPTLINGCLASVAYADKFTDLYPYRDIYGKYEPEKIKLVLYSQYKIIAFGDINFVYTAKLLLEKRSLVYKIKQAFRKIKQKLHIENVKLPSNKCNS